MAVSYASCRCCVPLLLIECESRNRPRTGKSREEPENFGTRNRRQARILQRKIYTSASTTNTHHSPPPRFQSCGIIPSRLSSAPDIPPTPSLAYNLLSSPCIRVRRLALSGNPNRRRRRIHRRDGRDAVVWQIGIDFRNVCR